MGIKVTENIENKDTDYPCLKESFGLVVLFTSKNTGTVLSSKYHKDMGYYTTEWPEENFTPYNCKITLENE